MNRFSLRSLTILFVLSLISFLSFASPALFSSIQPGPLQFGESLVFNCLVASLLVCYVRSCFTEPGAVPVAYQKKDSDLKDQKLAPGRRFCFKCQNVKPPRAHHCRICAKCVRKMDHHCVWMSNCVSYRTFPHFVRFLIYAVAAMAYLEFHIFIRLRVIWENRRLPGYLGPSVWQLVHLLLLSAINSITLFAVFVILCKSIWSLIYNITTIEGWEIERHIALLKRARLSGGQIHGPHGIVVKIERHEFPYDIGIWRNISQGMGTRNVCSWFNPFAFSVKDDGGTAFEVNGIDFPHKPWPPPDPEKLASFTKTEIRETPDFARSSERDAFRRRQAADLTRRCVTSEYKIEDEQLRPYAVIEDERDNIRTNMSRNFSEEPASRSSPKRWVNNEGERLMDFGVDEEAEVDFVDTE